jgi:hypothetical protein
VCVCVRVRIEQVAVIYHWSGLRAVDLWFTPAVRVRVRACRHGKTVAQIYDGHYSRPSIQINRRRVCVRVRGMGTGRRRRSLAGFRAVDL